jgi:hypothetical protein
MEPETIDETMISHGKNETGIAEEEVFSRLLKALVSRRHDKKTVISAEDFESSGRLTIDRRNGDWFLTVDEPEVG